MSPQKENTKRPFKETLFGVIQFAAHAVILMSPLFYSKVLHQSDSMLTHTPTNYGDLDMNNNITEVGFALRRFSTNGTEDIRFSHEQQDTFDDNYDAAHRMYHALRAIMWIALIAPLVLALASKLICKYSATCKEVHAKWARTYAMKVTPILIFVSILMIIPFVLLWNSSLCGPDYMELQYEVAEDSNSNSSSSSSDEESFDDDHGYDGCGGPNYYEGTITIFHENIPATCKLGTSGIGFLLTTVIYPLALVAHAYVLMRIANRLETQIMNDNARAILDNGAGPEIKVLDSFSSHDMDDGDDETEVGSCVEKGDA